MLDRQPTGFSLLELMVALVVVAILTLVAVPSYRQYVVRGNRTVAKSELLDASVRQRQYFSDNKVFAQTLTDLDFPADPYYVDAAGNAGGTRDGDGIYQITLTAPSGALTFTLSAIPTGSQTHDTDCGTLTLTDTGARDSSTHNRNCW